MKYENITLIGDFNMQPGNKNLKDFRDLNQLEHLILKPTCYKGKAPSTIGLIITNHKTIKPEILVSSEASFLRQE